MQFGSLAGREFKTVAEIMQAMPGHGAGGLHNGTMLKLWFWTSGAPRPGRSSQICR